MSERKEKKLLLNDALIKEVANGVHSTLVGLAGIIPLPGAMQVGESSDVRGDVSGIVSVVQETVNATLVVTFPKETIFAILSKLYKKPFTQVDPSVRSGVGELTNMIYGVIKASLNRKGYQFKMAIPSVVAGEHHAIAHYGEGAALTLPFSTQVGDFTVCLIMGHETAVPEAA